MAPAPKLPLVTGISPKEGPPGTKITIRGVKICDVDCLMFTEWISSSKLVTRSGLIQGKGDIIIATISGGIGTSTVQFRGYYEAPGPLQPSAFWIDESKTFLPVGFPKNQPLAKLDSSTLFTDPLGLNIDAGTGISKEKPKFPIDELQELYPDNSGNIRQESFLPTWFLLENYHQNSFQELKKGLEYMRESVNIKNEGPNSFIKTNIITFLGCLDAMEMLNAKMDEDKQKTGSIPKILEKLDKELTTVENKSNSLFNDILGNKSRADSTRNALALINRFKLCFNLPRTLSKSIAKGDYAMAINDYNRANTLYFSGGISGTGGIADLPIFKQIINIANSKMDGLKKTLRSQLFNYPSTLEEQKNILKFLVDVDPKTDSAWESIVKMSSWLTLILIDCKDRNLKKCQLLAKRDTSYHNDQLNPIRSDKYIIDSNRNNGIFSTTGDVRSLTEIKSAPNLYKKEYQKYLKHLELIQFKKFVVCNLLLIQEIIFFGFTDDFAECSNLKLIFLRKQNNYLNSGYNKELDDFSTLFPELLVGSKQDSFGDYPFFGKNDEKDDSMQNNPNLTASPLTIYVEELSALMSQGFSDFWQLGQAYFSGLLPVNKDMSGGDKTFKIDPNKFQRFKHFIHDIVSLYCDLIRSIFIPSSIVSNKIEANTDTQTKDTQNELLSTPRRVSVLGDWTTVLTNYFMSMGEINTTFNLYKIVKDIRVCQSYILHLGDENRGEEVSGSVANIPENSINLLKMMVNDMRTYAILTIFENGRKEMKRLCLKENWKILVDFDTNNGFGHTKIIECFRDMLEKYCKIAKWFIEPYTINESGGKNANFLDDTVESNLFHTNQTASKQYFHGLEPEPCLVFDILKKNIKYAILCWLYYFPVALACTKMVLGFYEAFQFLAFGIVTQSQQSHSVTDKSTQKTGQNVEKNNIIHEDAEIEKTLIMTSFRNQRIKKERRLLYCLSNVEYFLQTIVKIDLVKILNANSISSTDNIQKKISHTFQDLNQSLFDAYVKRVSKPITENISRNMSDMSFDWKDCPEPTDVRLYARVILQGCVEIYTEVESVCPTLLKRIMNRVVENIFEKLYEIYLASSLYTDKSLLQAKLDTSCLDLVLCGFLTPKSKQSLDQIYTLFARLKESPNYESYKSKLSSLQTNFKEKSLIELQCLNTPNLVQI